MLFLSRPRSLLFGFHLIDNTDKGEKFFFCQDGTYYFQPSNILVILVQSELDKTKGKLRNVNQKAILMA